MFNRYSYASKGRILAGYIPLFIAQMIFIVVLLELPELFIYIQLMLIPFGVLIGYIFNLLLRRLYLIKEEKRLYDKILNFAIKALTSYLLLMLVIIFSLLAITLPSHIVFMYMAWGYAANLSFLFQLYLGCIANIILSNPELHLALFVLPWILWYIFSYFLAKYFEIIKK